MNAEQEFRQAIEFYRRGEMSAAEHSCRQILAADPASFAAHHLLGAIRSQQGRHGEALALLGDALKINPQAADAHSNHGLALLGLGRFEDALASFDKAVAIKPDFIEALCNRGGILLELGRPIEALASFDKVLGVRPDFIAALYNRSKALRLLGRFEEALASYDKLLTLRPRYPEALCDRGLVLWELHRYAEALSSYEAALALRPDYAEALNNRGVVLADLKRAQEALASYDRALARRPDYAEAFNNRGFAFADLKRFKEALASYEAALAAAPDHPYALGGIAYAALNLCDWPRTEKIAGEIGAKIAAGSSVVMPLALLGLSDDAVLQLQCAKTHVRDRIAARPPALWSGTAYRHERIRIAYVSSDFRQHAMSCLITELFERHSRSDFEVLGVSIGPDDGSALRARVIKSFDRFHDLWAESDDAAAKLLRGLEVDIAIDLNGYTQGGRPRIFSHRPAPVQVSYIGYPATMGADFIDYIFADAVVAPFDQQAFFAEKIVHLPDCYLANDTRRAIAPKRPSRGEAGLPEKGFVFCCFNNNWKITAPLFDIWMRLLEKVPGSVLWLLEDNEGAGANLRAAAAARGIDPQRLVFAPRVKAEDHLARQHLADLFLDTLPYNAHTTASEALWSGVPLVTCPGRAFAGRVAASLLHAVAMPELVTENLEDYEALALKLATKPAQLKAVREKLAAARLTTPLFDTDRLRRHIESAYRTMCDISRRGEKPRSFAVEPVE